MIKENKKKGFTLVELLAVIVILAIILVIAVPKVMDVINDSKKATLESTAKMIASAAEKAKVQNTVLGKTEEITCDSVAKINDLDYEDCDIDFADNTAKVTITGKGKFAGLYICNGTKTDSEATKDECQISTETAGCDTLYWDGNTEGVESLKLGGYEYYKISNIAPTVEQFINNGATTTLIVSNQEVDRTISSGDVQAGQGPAYMIYTASFPPILVVTNDTTEGGVTASAGTYFMSQYDSAGVYVNVKSLTINGYTGFPHSDHCGHR